MVSVKAKTRVSEFLFFHCYNPYIAGIEIVIVSNSFERPGWDEYFMLQAELAKLRSNCMTRQVGAVIVRNHRQLATGYNGTPPRREKLL